MEIPEKSWKNPGKKEKKSWERLGRRRIDTKTPRENPKNPRGLGSAGKIFGIPWICKEGVNKSVKNGNFGKEFPKKNPPKKGGEEGGGDLGLVVGFGGNKGVTGSWLGEGRGMHPKNLPWILQKLGWIP